jgi:hypothetical protein
MCNATSRDVVDAPVGEEPGPDQEEGVVPVRDLDPVQAYRRVEMTSASRPQMPASSGADSTTFDGPAILSRTLLAGREPPGHVPDDQESKRSRNVR